MKKIEGIEPIKYIWSDKKRILGMPVSFTTYSMTEDRLFVKTGLLSTTQEEILLYRVRDLTFKQSLGQKIFGVGSVVVHSSDKTTAHCELKNIKMPFEVKELIHKNVELQKKSHNVGSSEFLRDAHDECDGD